MPRLLLAILVLTIGTACAGLVRGYVLFVPGILGMAFGGFLGYATGLLARGDSASPRAFGPRLWLVAGAGLLYCVGTAAVVALVNVGTTGFPLEWLEDVLKGFEGEFFAGQSRNSFQAVSGVLEGGWWVVFHLLDAGLFAFLFLVTNAVGLGDVAEEDLPDAPSRSGVPGFVACVAVSAGVVAFLNSWPMILYPSPERSPEEAIDALRGDWAFGDGADFLGADEEERSFSAFRGLGTELAGVSKQPQRFIVSMEPVWDGSFEGRILLPGGRALSARMELSDADDEMRFVIEWPTRAGTEERRVVARRLPRGS
jgi:hypothetical protein